MRTKKSSKGRGRAAKRPAAKVKKPEARGSIFPANLHGPDIVDEASLESFPASDPPGWTAEDGKPKKSRAAGQGKR